MSPATWDSLPGHSIVTFVWCAELPQNRKSIYTGRRLPGLVLPRHLFPRNDYSETLSLFQRYFLFWNQYCSCQLPEKNKNKTGKPYILYKNKVKLLALDINIHYCLTSGRKHLQYLPWHDLLFPSVLSQPQPLVRNNHSWGLFH